MFSATEGDTTDVYWVEARDAAKHSKMHRMVSETKNYLDQKVNNFEIEKTCY